MRRSLLAILSVALLVSGASAITITVPTEGTVYEAVAAAGTGDIVYVLNGTYTLNTTLNLNKAITLRGESQAGVVFDIDVGTDTAYGIHPSVGGVAMEDFTLNVIKSSGTTMNYPIHASGTPNVMDGLEIRRVTIQGSGSGTVVKRRAGLDIHGYDNVVIDEVTSKDSTWGNGIQITGCANVTVDNCTTSNNAWGSLAVYVSQYLVPGPRGSSFVTIDGPSCSFGEGVVFTEDQFGAVSTDVVVTGYQYYTRNMTFRDGAEAFTHFHPDFTAAQAFAALVYAGFEDATTYQEIASGDFTVLAGMSIQAAIDAADVGDTVNVGTGHFEGQLHVTTEDLSIVGAGVGATFVDCPAALTLFYTTSGENRPIVFVDGVDAFAMSELTVDGLGRGNANNRFQGVGLWNSGGDLTNLNIVNVIDTPFSGVQHGVGVYAYNDTGGPYTANLTGVSVSNFQKGAIAMNGTGLTANMVGCSTVGAGPTAVTAQNGIQFYGSAGGTIDGCTVTGNIYTGDGWAASGVLLISNGTVDITDSVVNDGDPAIYCQDTDANADGLEIYNSHVDSGNGFYVRVQSGALKAGEADIAVQEEPSPFGDWVASGDKALGVANVTIQNSKFTGQTTGYGVAASNYIVADLIDIAMTTTEVSNWGWGVVAYGSGGEIAMDMTGNRFLGNDGYFYAADTLLGTQNASGNFWGVTDVAVLEASILGAVDYSPWLGFVPGTTPMTWYANASIQEAIDAAAAGDVVLVQPGFYEERLSIDKSLTLLGATDTVNKRGVAVPVDYAWDTGVESVVSYPDPTGLLQADSQLMDIAASNVTVKGFVFQVLNARCGFNGDNLFRVNAGIAGGPGTYIENVVVQNNVLGPATNVDLQAGTCGRMNLYLASPTYPTHRQGIINSTISGNKIFGAEGNGNNVFVWGGAESYNSVQNADYSGTVIEDNEITGSHRTGIEIAGGVSNLTIRNNEISDNASTNGGLSDPNLKYGNGILVVRMGSDKTSPTAMSAAGLTITGNTITGNEKHGIYLGPFNTGHLISGNEFTGNGMDGVHVDLTELYYGGAYPETGIAAGITATDNEFVGNGGGASVVGVPTNGFVLAAVGNWWNSASGPYNATTNPLGTGEAVSDYVDFDPWVGMGGVALVPDVSGPINCLETQTLVVHYTPDTMTPALRGFTITVDASDELSFGEGDIGNTFPFAGLGSLIIYDTTDNLDGTVSVDIAIAGTTTGLVGEADLFSVVMHPAGDGVGTVDLLDVVFRDVDNNDIGADVSAATVTVDCTNPPAVTDLAAAPVHEGVELAWTMADASDVDHYEVWRAVWHTGDNTTSAYPEYDDDNPVEPVRPADRAAALASPEWQPVDLLVDGAASAFADAYAPRGVYYYEVYAVDAADNVSDAAPAGVRATNYYLGDVEDPYDGSVGVGDMSLLGAAYGTVEGGEDYNPEIDFGPTDDRSGLGVPTTDNEVGFEDLMIFALNFDTVGKGLPETYDTMAELSWLKVDDQTWTLELSGPCDNLQGLNLRAALPEGVTATVRSGALLERQTAPTFVGNVDRNGLDVGLAVLGHGVGISGEGTLLEVVFSAPVELTPNLAARGLDNAELEISLVRGAADLPTAFALVGNHPNPFNPSTTIAFDLPAAAKVRLAVYGLDGSLVRTLLDEGVAAGRHTTVWNGRDDSGRSVSSGAYFYRIESNNRSFTHKMLLMK